MTQELRLADLLAALSLTTDLAMGQQPEKAIRAAVVATEIGRHMALGEAEIADVYYTTLLKHLGCTATLHEEAFLFGPDGPTVRRVAERTDPVSPREVLGLLAVAGHGAGLGRPRYLMRALTAGKDSSASIFRAVCEVGTRLASRLGLGRGVEIALYQGLERWDGKGDPQGLRGEEIALPSRIAEPATQAIVFDRLGGPDAALAMADRRAGGWFDPAVVGAFRAVGPSALARLRSEDPWTMVLEAEPDPVRRIPADRVDGVAETFADMVDVMTPYTIGHSPGVADLATAAAERLGMPDVSSVRLASLLHDLGRTAVSVGVWEKQGALTTAEWEQVRLHAYHTERILSRSAVLEPIARIAGMHHERLDGSGYHRGSSAAEEAPEARVIAIADAYQAMTQDRPHRPRLTDERAADELFIGAREGRLDPECVRAVVEAAGLRPTTARVTWAAGLSDREVQVLRLLTRGLSNRAIAAELVISPRTAEHHVQHIYAKIGVSTRAGATIFALEHGLLRG